MKTELRGFALIELIVSMALSLLVIVLGYQTLLQFSRAIDRQGRVNLTAMECNRLCATLVLDVSRYTGHQSQANILKLYDAVDTVAYEFGPNVSVRRAGSQVDTFRTGTRLVLLADSSVLHIVYTASQLRVALPLRGPTAAASTLDGDRFLNSLRDE